MLNNPQAGLTPEKLQLFIAGLSGLNADEVRKAKILFIRNELSQLKALNKTMAGFGVASGLLCGYSHFLADPLGSKEWNERCINTSEGSDS